MTDPRERFEDVAALWSAGLAWPAEVVAAACDLLVTGAGGDALAMLAGLPYPEDEGVQELLEPALQEVGLAYHPPGAAGALEHAIAAKAREALAGAITPRALVQWAAEAVGYQRLWAAERLILFDASYHYEPDDPSPLDDDVLAEAAALSDARRPGRSPR